MAATPHPQALGSALTHRYITTDYAEALPEFVTTPETSSWAVAQMLCDIHQFTFRRIGDEMLWPLSMPCRLARRSRHRHRAIRQFECRAHEDDLSRGPRQSLRSLYAGHRGYSLQLLAARGILAAVGGHHGTGQQPATEVRFLFGRRAQCAPARLVDSLSIWRVARDLRQFPARCGCRPRATRQRHLRRPLCDLVAHERPGVSEFQPVVAQRVGQQPAAIHSRSESRHRNPESRLRGNRCEGGRRIPAAERQPAADRERVLQHDPAEARGALGRAAHRGARARRHRVRRAARARSESVRPGGHQSLTTAVPRSVPDLLPRESRVRRSTTRRCGATRAITWTSPVAAASRVCSYCVARRTSIAATGH